MITRVAKEVKWRSVANTMPTRRLGSMPLNRFSMVIGGAPTMVSARSMIASSLGARAWIWATNDGA